MKRAGKWMLRHDPNMTRIFAVCCNMHGCNVPHFSNAKQLLCLRLKEATTGILAVKLMHQHVSHRNQRLRNTPTKSITHISSVKEDYRTSSLPTLQTSPTLQRQGTKPAVVVEIQRSKEQNCSNATGIEMGSSNSDKLRPPQTSILYNLSPWEQMIYHMKRR